jgi:hypothetical protein
MDKNKFLDKIFEEFERRLTRVIELGYCSLTLEVENSLKSILTKTINSSAGIQTKVLKEITTMKEYVVEVASEGKPNIAPDNEEENVQLPDNTEETINNITKNDIKAEKQSPQKKAAEKKVEEEETPSPENVNKSVEKDDNLNEDTEQDLPTDKTPSFEDDDNVKEDTPNASPVKVQITLPKVNKNKRKSKRPQPVQLEKPAEKNVEDEIIEIDDSSCNADDTLMDRSSSVEKEAVSKDKDLYLHCKPTSFLQAKPSSVRKTEQNSVDEMEIDVNNNKKTKPSKLMGPKSKKIRSNPIPEAPMGGFEDELALAIRLSMNPTEQTSKELQDYVTACSKSMLEPAANVAPETRRSQDKPCKEEPKPHNKKTTEVPTLSTTKKTFPEVPTFSIARNELKQPVAKPKKKIAVVKKSKGKKQRKRVSFGKKSHKKIEEAATKDKAFKCDDCIYSTDRKTKLLLHLFNIHNKKDNDENDDITVVEDKIDSKNQSAFKKSERKISPSKEFNSSPIKQKDNKKKRGKPFELPVGAKNKNKIKKDISKIVQDIICL